MFSNFDSHVFINAKMLKFVKSRGFFDSPSTVDDVFERFDLWNGVDSRVFVTRVVDVGVFFVRPVEDEEKMARVDAELVRFADENPVNANNPDIGEYVVAKDAGKKRCFRAVILDDAFKVAYVDTGEVKVMDKEDVFSLVGKDEFVAIKRTPAKTKLVVLKQLADKIYNESILVEFERLVSRELTLLMVTGMHTTRLRVFNDVEGDIVVATFNFMNSKNFEWLEIED